jgi:hemerythrin-like domain-containing protein
MGNEFIREEHMHEDFFNLLKEEHSEVKNILTQLSKTEQGDSKKREELFMELKNNLLPHMNGEESYFYPALKEHEDARKKALESLEEHHAAKTILDELDRLGKGEESWGAKLNVMKELIEHHIEEEQEEVFKKAEKDLDHDKVGEIMNNFKREKEEFRKSA